VKGEAKISRNQDSLDMDIHQLSLKPQKAEEEKRGPHKMMERKNNVFRCRNVSQTIG